MGALGVPLLIVVVFAAMCSLGVAFWAKRLGAAVYALYALTIGIVVWAGHYYNQLSWDAQGDLLWHKRYMLSILILGPLSIVLSALVGYKLRMKEYRRVHGGIPDAGEER